ncbi:MAG: hypothetical protein AB1861_29115 [Cyanobacteriota bacterium]
MWQDIYKGVNRIGLSWFIQSGEVILTPEEQAEAAQAEVTTAQAVAAACCLRAS